MCVFPSWLSKRRSTSINDDFSTLKYSQLCPVSVAGVKVTIYSYPRWDSVDPGLVGAHSIFGYRGPILAMRERRLIKNHGSTTLSGDYSAMLEFLSRPSAPPPPPVPIGRFSCATRYQRLPLKNATQIWKSNHPSQLTWYSPYRAIIAFLKLHDAPELSAALSRSVV